MLKWVLLFIPSPKPVFPPFATFLVPATFWVLSCHRLHWFSRLESFSLSVFHDWLIFSITSWKTASLVALSGALLFLPALTPYPSKQPHFWGEFINLFINIYSNLEFSCFFSVFTCLLSPTLPLNQSVSFVRAQETCHLGCCCSPNLVPWHMVDIQWTFVKWSKASTLGAFCVCIWLLVMVVVIESWLCLLR